MLIFNGHQMQALEQAQRRRLADELLPHVEQFTPRHAASLGREGLLNTIHLGLDRADAHGLEMLGAVRFYIEVMFMLGSDFDSDPQYALITRPLHEPDGMTDLVRADLMHEQLLRFVAQTSGAHHRLELAALERAANARYEHVQWLSQRPPQDTLDLLAAIHPEKAAFVGPTALATLVGGAFEQARAHGPEWRALGPVLAALAFTFGHGCASDPQYPWIAEALRDNADGDTVSRCLFGRFAAFVAASLSLLEPA